MTKKRKSITKQIAEYFVAGGAFFWSGYIAFAVFDSIFHLPLFVAKQGANLIGITVNYLLESHWVFATKSQKNIESRRTGRYILITLINFGIDYLLILQLKNIGITPYIGQFASAGFFTIWNFLWYKYWVFAPHTPKHHAKRRK
jgi:putative flippase GtrA